MEKIYTNYRSEDGISYVRPIIRYFTKEKMSQIIIGILGHC